MSDLIIGVGQFLGLMLTIAGLFWAFSVRNQKLFESLLDARFKAAEAARKSSEKQLAIQMDQLLKGEVATVKRLDDVERDLLALRVELPEKYVRREDHIRGQTVIESKLDALALRVENLQLRERKV